MNTNLLSSVLAFLILTALWLGFGTALFLNPHVLGKVWLRFHSWNIFLQLLVALLVLPVVLGLWIWQTRWPTWLRLVFVVALAWMTVYTFFPRLLFG